MPKMKANTFARCVSIAIVTSLSGAAHAAIVNAPGTPLYNPTSETAFPVSSTDLINQGQPTFSSQTVTGFAPYTCCAPGVSDTAALNDGSAGTASQSGGTAFDLDGTWTSTFNLNLATNTNGYDITGVNTFSGWPDTRTDQKYELLYSTAATPAAFVSLGTFSFGPQAGGSAEISLIDTSGIIAHNVAAVRFNFEDPGFNGNDQTVYREIDVFGTASSPEPGSLGLLGLAACGILGRRRRV